MSKLIFSQERTEKSIGYIGGGLDKFPKELWRNIPNKNTYQTHLFTLYPQFHHESEKLHGKRISVFISLEKHALGGVKTSLTDKFQVHSQADLDNIKNGYAYAVIYELESSIEEYNLGEFTLPRKYFEPLNYTDPKYKEYAEKEHEFFEETGMGLDISKYYGNFYFEQDRIRVHPKYKGLLQLLEEDIENTHHIFQRGIGYFYLNKNIKKLKHGDEAGIFFIQNT